MFRDAYQIEVTIDASPERVWAVLVDVDRYPEWNPFTVEATSTLEVGEPVDLLVKLRGRLRKQREILRSITPNERLCWGMSMLGGIVVRGERCQWLEALSENRTRYTSRDVISGTFAPFVKALYGRSLREGFAEMAEALKERVEADP